MPKNWGVEGADVLVRGGPILWVIALLSVLTLALILWKIWRFTWLGVWRRSDTAPALSAWSSGDVEGAAALMRGARGLRGRVAGAAMTLKRDPQVNEALAREEITRLAMAQLREARSGLRTLELIAQIAPLLGLLGTVIGMIDAFQALQAAGAQADPSDLAGGIWQALLTTAAGMGVAIPAALASTYFDGVVERAQGEMEDVATLVFTRGPAFQGA